MTTNPPAIKQLVQVSEQVFEPIQVPVQIGTEVYVIVQQDIRKIEDVRHLSYYKYLTEPQGLNICNPQLHCTNLINENQIWDNLATALLALQSVEMNPMKTDLINKFLEILYSTKKQNNIASIDNQMQWENIPKDWNQETPICPLYSTSPKCRKFIRNVCCCSCPPPIVLRNRGTDTSCYVEVEEDSNVRELLLQKKKAADILY